MYLFLLYNDSLLIFLYVHFFSFLTLYYYYYYYYYVLNAKCFCKKLHTFCTRYRDFVIEVRMILRNSSKNLRGVFHNAPSVYPFLKPFHDTPHDQDRTRHDITKKILSPSKKWPLWMDEGGDGTGYGIGLHRSHPLSKLRGNLKRNPQDVPRVLNMMIQGVWHKSGNKLYFRGGKPPNPSVHPYLTGEPCPVYGWKVLDESVTREFNVPNIEKEKLRYKPYVALHERRLMGSALVSQNEKVDSTASPPVNVSSSNGANASIKKPLVKRLFFWQ